MYHFLFIFACSAFPCSPLSCGFITKHAWIEWLKLIKKNLRAHFSYFSFYKVYLFRFPMVFLYLFYECVLEKNFFFSFLVLTLQYYKIVDFGNCWFNLFHPLCYQAKAKSHKNAEAKAHHWWALVEVIFLLSLLAGRESLFSFIRRRLFFMISDVCWLPTPVWLYDVLSWMADR